MVRATLSLSQCCTYPESLSLMMMMLLLDSAVAYCLTAVDGIIRWAATPAN